MDPSYDNKPSMNSETTWNRPNRYRSEAPLYYAAYGALQDSDAIVHFAKAHVVHMGDLLFHQRQPRVDRRRDRWLPALDIRAVFGRPRS